MKKTNTVLDEIYDIMLTLVLKLAKHKEACMASYSRLFYASCSMWYLINDTPENQMLDTTLLLLSDFENTLAHLNHDLFTLDDPAALKVIESTVQELAIICSKLRVFLRTKWGWVG